MTPVCAFGHFKVGRLGEKKKVNGDHYFPVQETPIMLLERICFPFPWFYVLDSVENRTEVYNLSHSKMVMTICEFWQHKIYK